MALLDGGSVLRRCGRFCCPPGPSRRHRSRRSPCWAAQITDSESPSDAPRTPSHSDSSPNCEPAIPRPGPCVLQHRPRPSEIPLPHVMGVYRTGPSRASHARLWGLAQSTTQRIECARAPCGDVKEGRANRPSRDGPMEPERDTVGPPRAQVVLPNGPRAVKPGCTA